MPRCGRRCNYGCGCICLSLFCTVYVGTFIFSILSLLLWIIYYPHNLKFHVTAVSLTEFNLTTANTTTTKPTTGTLSYNLVLNMTVRNPNQRTGVYFDSIDIMSFYKDETFGSVTLATFYQRPKNTTNLDPAFEGQSLVSFSNKTLTDFYADKDSGVYSINVKVYMRIREKFGFIKGKRFKDQVECKLRVPFSFSNASVVPNSFTFKTTKCKLIKDPRRDPEYD